MINESIFLYFLSHYVFSPLAMLLRLGIAGEIKKEVTQKTQRGHTLFQPEKSSNNHY